VDHLSSHWIRSSVSFSSRSYSLLIIELLFFTKHHPTMAHERTVDVDIDSVDDSDAELPEETNLENRCAWRKNKNGEDTFSDWTIVATVVLTSGSNGEYGEEQEQEQEQVTVTVTTRTFNVHKYVLAVGPRRSEYFEKLFDSEYAESQDNTSRIELSEREAKAFPLLLDYMYDAAAPKPPFTTDNATALYSLAKRFLVTRLYIEAKAFCRQDMQHADKCGTYYEHATILQAKSILTLAAEYCRKNITIIKPSPSRLHHVPNPQFWIDLMKDQAEKGTLQTLWDGPGHWELSGHIAMFCEKHHATLSPETFLQLTDEAFLPESQIRPLNAMVLLDCERRIIGYNEDGVVIGYNEDGVDGELSNLQNRLVNAVARGKKKDFLPLLNCKPWFLKFEQNISPLIRLEIRYRGLTEE
jgi:BTB/POZ domain